MASTDTDPYDAAWKLIWGANKKLNFDPFTEPEDFMSLAQSQMDVIRGLHYMALLATKMKVS